MSATAVLHIKINSNLLRLVELWHEASLGSSDENVFDVPLNPKLLKNGESDIMVILIFRVHVEIPKKLTVIFQVQLRQKAKHLSSSEV